MVTPFVGVWIETDKQHNAHKGLDVTPFVGVWIETYFTRTAPLDSKSHPSWVCGLKRIDNRLKNDIYESHPSWVCGLKLYMYVCACTLYSHTLRGCVD